MLVVVYWGAGGAHYNYCDFDVTGNDDGEWHHYAFTVVDDGGNSKFEFFMDGTKKSVDSNVGGTVSGDGYGFTVYARLICHDLVSALPDNRGRGGASVVF